MERVKDNAAHPATRKPFLKSSKQQFNFFLYCMLPGTKQNASNYTLAIVSPTSLSSTLSFSGCLSLNDTHTHTHRGQSKKVRRWEVAGGRERTVKTPLYTVQQCGNVRVGGARGGRRESGGRNIKFMRNQPNCLLLFSVQCAI